MQKYLNYSVYIMASISGTLYVGVTSDLEKRVQQHRLGIFDDFSKKYGCNRKESLIQILNPAWIDLAQDVLA